METRSGSLQIRVKPSEKRGIEKIAGALDQTVSEYLYALVLKELAEDWDDGYLDD